MGSKLGYFINNVKNINPSVIIENIKLTRQKIKAKLIFNLASEVIDKAKELSKDEIKLLLKRISQVEKKTSTEIEKVFSIIVEQILKDKSIEAVSDEVKNEIVHKLAKYNDGKSLIPNLKYINKIIVTNVPKSVKSVKNFKRNVAKTLIKDAHTSLEGKKVVK